jgi:hypothetical protein
VVAQRVAEAEAAGAPIATSHTLIARHPDLIDHRGGALSRHYDVGAITASPLARTVFVLPER